MTVEDWQAVINVNLNAVYYLSQETAKVMATQGGGKIINICSMLSFQGGKFVPSYTAASQVWMIWSMTGRRIGRIIQKV